MRHAREDARVARSRAVYFARHTRDGELARRRIGSLSNDDGDGNENGKKAVGLDWENNNLHVYPAFLYIS